MADGVGSRHFRSGSEQVRRTNSLEVAKSRRTLRQSTVSMSKVAQERKAYPLPDPKQFESPAATTDDKILYPLRSFKQLTDREHEAVVGKEANKGEKEPAPKPLDLRAPTVGLKQPAVPLRSNSSVELDNLPEEVPTPTSSGRKVSKVVVVYDGEKTFTVAAVDAVLREHATREGDAILVVAFLEHIMSPMGMKMVADLRQFGGVNKNILNQQVYLKKNLIESKLQNTNHSQYCETKKIQLGVKVIPGANPKALVAEEILDFQATSAIFDKNAMRSYRKFYVENLSCNISRLSKDCRKLETVSLFGQSSGSVMKEEKTAAAGSGTTSTRSHCSEDSSSDSSSMNSLDSPSIWSRLRLFGSKRSSTSSSTTGPVLRPESFGSSESASLRVVDAAEVLDESFSFDSPKPAPGEAYVYAAAGVARPTALAA